MKRRAFLTGQKRSIERPLFLTLKIRPREASSMKSNNTVSLILLLARLNPSENEVRNAHSVITMGIDWEKFVRTVRLHGLGPLMYANAASFDDVPGHVKDILKKNYLSSMSRSLQMSAELRTIVEQLHSAGIEAVQLKGVTGAMEIFRDIALYPSSDIDILIKRDDILKVADVMTGLGYRATCNITDCYLETNDEVHFLREGMKPVDYHLSLVNRRYFKIPDSFWWDDLRDGNFEGTAYKILSGENNLFFSSLHLFTHGYSTLKFMVSFSEMLRAYEGRLNWEKLIGSSKQLNAYKSLLLSLALASKLLNAPVPETIINRIDSQSAKDTWICHMIEHNIFRDNVRLSKIMFLLTMLQYNIPEVFRRMVKWLLPSCKEISCRYNIPLTSKKIYLFYVLNPFFLLFLKRRH
jgi:hypothetical protein